MSYKNIIYKMNFPIQFPTKREIRVGVEYDEEQHKSFAIIPDSMLEEILATEGLCDLELSEDGTEVVSFTALEVPDFMKGASEPSTEERIAALEEENAMLLECVLEMSEVIYA